MKPSNGLVIGSALAAVALALGTSAVIAEKSKSPTSPATAKPASTYAPAPTELPRASLADDSAGIERGRYLVNITGCHDCHTPLKMGANGPEPDMSRMLSGHPQSMKLPAPPTLNDKWVYAGAATNTAFVGPWGTTYAFNLTPDKHTGLGIWTEEMFINAIRLGRHFGEARPIMPPMPWPAYARMSDQDLKSVYAYLRTIPPISNQVPDYEPPAKK